MFDFIPFEHFCSKGTNVGMLRLDGVLYCPHDVIKGYEILSCNDSLVLLNNLSDSSCEVMSHSQFLGVINE